MLKRKIDVHVKGKSVRTYIVLKVLKEDESMIRFVGTDTGGEIALVTAEKSNDGKYEVAGTFDIPEWELQQMYRLTIGNKLPEEEYDG